ncbi:MAG: hypothetical protein PHP30_05755 [Bacteroidales bacterium]|nr:hypothetical protein [Bacteroidales bacterium]MDD2425170.1 hypothetical protein [Bacteroidales bacterium]MDD3989583.1 hypothetical protein [Bacteroidales bacterium]
MKREIPIFVVVVILLQSCINLRSVDINSVSLNSFKLVNTSRADLVFEYTAENSTASSLVIASADGFIKKKGVNFAQMTLLQPDTIPAGSVKNGTLNVRFDLMDPISLLSMGLNIASWRAEDFNIDARIMLKSGERRKKVIRVKEIPLENLINKL